MSESTSPIAPVYHGDDLFAQLLADLQCPTPLHQVKCFVLGSMAATRPVRFDEILGVLWEGAEPVFQSREQAERFAGNLMGLMNQVGSKAGEFQLQKTNALDSLEAVAHHLVVRAAELQGFVAGLDAGETDPEAMTEDAQAALKTMAEGSAWIKKYQEMLTADREGFEQSLEEATEVLGQLDRVLEHSLSLIYLEQLAERRRSLERPKKPATTARAPGRNDPCPCGSGKKYKRCCGMH